MKVGPLHLKSCNQLELLSQLFKSRGETRIEQRLLGKVETSVHVAPTVILHCITFCYPRVLHTTLFHTCVLPRGAWFYFPAPNYISGHIVKGLELHYSFPLAWPLQDVILQRTKDLIFSWNALGQVVRLSIRGTKSYVPIIWWGRP